MKHYGASGPAHQQKGWTLLEALAAVVVVGIGVALFMKVQSSSSRNTGENSRILLAGKMIEKFLEDTRINIAKNPATNWPPTNQNIAASAPNFIAIKSTVSTAYSPLDGTTIVTDVRRMDIVASWTRPFADSLKVTTYVSKRF